MEESHNATQRNVVDASCNIVAEHNGLAVVHYTGDIPEHGTGPDSQYVVSKGVLDICGAAHATLGIMNASVNEVVLKNVPVESRAFGIEFVPDIQGHATQARTLVAPRSKGGTWVSRFMRAKTCVEAWVDEKCDSDWLLVVIDVPSTQDKDQAATEAMRHKEWLHAMIQQNVLFILERDDNARMLPVDKLPLPLSQMIGNPGFPGLKFMYSDRFVYTFAGMLPWIASPLFNSTNRCCEMSQFLSMLVGTSSSVATEHVVRCALPTGMAYDGSLSRTITTSANLRDANAGNTLGAIEVDAAPTPGPFHMIVVLRRAADADAPDPDAAPVENALYWQNLLDCWSPDARTRGAGCFYVVEQGAPSLSGEGGAVVGSFHSVSVAHAMQHATPRAGSSQFPTIVRNQSMGVHPMAWSQ